MTMISGWCVNWIANLLKLIFHCLSFATFSSKTFTSALLLSGLFPSFYDGDGDGHVIQLQQGFRWQVIESFSSYTEGNDCLVSLQIHHVRCVKKVEYFDLLNREKFSREQVRENILKGPNEKTPFKLKLAKVYVVRSSAKVHNTVCSILSGLQN